MKGWHSVVVVRPCLDFVKQCTNMASRGAFSSTCSSRFMQESCRKTCEFCTQSDVTFAGDERKVPDKGGSSTGQPVKEIPTPSISDGENRNGSDCLMDDDSSFSESATHQPQ